MALKVFVSQPMNGRSNEEILSERYRILRTLIAECGDVELIDSFIEGAPYKATPIQNLGESIKKMAEADLAIFAPKWETARGCRIEELVAREYKIKNIVHLKSI